MNARQKAKKYKRMYEELLNQPAHVIFETEQHSIDTLKFERFYDSTLLMEEDIINMREIIARDLAQSIANNLDKYIDYGTEFCQYMNEYRLYGEIKIVNKL